MAVCIIIFYSTIYLLAAPAIGGIYYSSNGGFSWAKSNAPISVFYWYGITSSSNGQYLAAGTNGNI